VRIVHLSQPTDGGTAVVVRELARAGVAAGDDVTVAGPAGGYLARWAAEAGARWVEVPMTRAPSLADLRAVRRVRRLAAGADVVHLHSSKAGAVGRLAVGRGPDRPAVVFTPHAWSWYTGGRLGRAYRRFERWAAARADAITVVSVEEERDGRAVLGDRPRIEVIPNGVDLAAFAPEGPVAERDPAPLVVQVGRLSRQKGQDRTLAALARTGPDVRLRLVGDGPDAAALRARARELGVDGRVEFAGSVDPRPHVRAADLVVLPSRWEGMSLVLLETMALGRAVVATRCGGVEALADAGVTIGNDEALVAGDLADAVTGLLADTGQRADLGRRAHERVAAHFDLARTVRAYARLWADLLARGDDSAR
jgi:glycosyltransferase involved in cell wall biosynthesis